MSNDPKPTHFEALGHFVVAFSRVVGYLQSGLIAVSCNNDERAIAAMKIQVAGATADQLRGWFFAICSTVGDLTTEDEAIRGALNKQVTGLIQKRNEIMHAVWSVIDEREIVAGRYGRVALYGLARRDLNTNAAELMSLADEANSLGPFIWLFAYPCIEPGRRPISEVFEIRDGLAVTRTA